MGVAEMKTGEGAFCQVLPGLPERKWTNFPFSGVHPVGFGRDFSNMRIPGPEHILQPAGCNPRTLNQADGFPWVLD